jgi:MFS family permease
MTIDSVSPRLTHHRSFTLFWSARTLTTLAYMMQAVAIGWQVYDLTASALDLGLVGLIQFVPVVAMGLFVGQIADRYDRRAVVRCCQVIKAAVAALLAAGSIGGWLDRNAILALLFLTGTARAFETPTMHALLPGLVPPVILPRAIAASATAMQTAVIVGPAVGGLIYAFGPAAVYLICTVAFLLASLLIGLVDPEARSQEKEPVSVRSLLAGFAFIRERRPLLGAISLDLIAVLLGGVTALLPIFARDVFGTGPWGLGLLRSAPAVGALCASILLAHYTIGGRLGLVLFGSVAAFALSTIVFALSTSLVLSLAALVIYGAADAVSVVIRHSLIQIRTPRAMLGRVMAVNAMFTGSSGTLGEFRAGAVAAAVGVVGSALIGGVAALAIAALWMRLFPELLRIDRLQSER